MARIVLQRVLFASVHVDDDAVAEIGRGLLLLVGIGLQDTAENVERVADRVAVMRVFEDDAGKVNLSARDVGAAMLVVSQFTLLAGTSRGRRPSFVGAAQPESASKLVDLFVRRLQAHGHHVEQGRFGTHMKVSLLNDGPFTLVLDS